LEHIDSASIKRLKFIALEQDKTIRDLFLEALADLLKKYRTQNTHPEK
jgi:NRPS condensation-like uncharacterized protein